MANLKNHKILKAMLAESNNNLKIDSSIHPVAFAIYGVVVWVWIKNKYSN